MLIYEEGQCNSRFVCEFVAVRLCFPLELRQCLVVNMLVTFSPLPHSRAFWHLTIEMSARLLLLTETFFSLESGRYYSLVNGKASKLLSSLCIAEHNFSFEGQNRGVHRVEQSNFIWCELYHWLYCFYY